MARKNRFNHKRHQRTQSTARAAVTREPPKVYEKKAPIQYGKPFILLEDPQKNTFEYARGTWVAYAQTIAQCRQIFQVTELPQKVNGMTRYEIRSPLLSAADN